MSFLIFWVMFHDSHVVKNEIFKPINLVIEVILGYISPKAFPKDCCYYGAYKWLKFFYPPGEISFLVSLFLSIQLFFPWVAGCHLIIRVVFHKTISNLFFSLLVFQQLHSSICCNRALSTSCFPSFRSHCDVSLFNPSSRLSKIMFFSCLSI